MANIKIIRDANGNYSKKGGADFGTTKPFLQSNLGMDANANVPHRIKNRITNKIVDGTKYVKKEVFKYNYTTGKPKSVTTTYYQPTSGFYPLGTANPDHGESFNGTGTIKRITETHTDSYALVCAELTTDLTWKNPIELRSFAGYRGRASTTDNTTGITGGTVNDFNSVLIQHDGGIT